MLEHVATRSSVVGILCTQRSKVARLHQATPASAPTLPSWSARNLQTEKSEVLEPRNDYLPPRSQCRSHEWSLGPSNILLRQDLELTMAQKPIWYGCALSSAQIMWSLHHWGTPTPPGRNLAMALASDNPELE